MSETVGWGVDAIVDGEGNVTRGTNADEVRRIWGSLYSPGVITGCAIEQSTTAMEYTVNAGTVAVQVVDSPRECVMVPINSTSLLVEPTGATPREDIIYVEQSMAGSNIATVLVGQTLPVDRAVQMIGKFTVPPNSTNTSGALKQTNILYSVPYGANLGHFYSHTDTSNSNLPTTSTTIATGTFSIPLDRKVLFTLDACLSAVHTNGTPAIGFDNSAFCEAKYEFFLNGVQRWVWRSPGLSQAWGSYNFSEYMNLTAGEYTVSYKAYNLGVGRARRHYRGGDLTTGTSFNVRDSGFWEPLNEATW